ncbi:unnamed protein product, partial [Bubo scandiacus]
MGPGVNHSGKGDGSRLGRKRKRKRGRKEGRKKEKERKKEGKKGREETSSHYTSSWGRREEAFIRLTIIFSFNHLCSFQIKKEILIKGLEEQKCLLGLS